MLPNVSIAPNRHKLPHYVHLAGTICTHLLALYWLMVFIHETHVMPSSGKVKTKVIWSHNWFLHVVSAAQCVSCTKHQQITTLHTFVFYILWHYIDWWCLFMKHMWCHLVALYWLMVFIHETHVMPSSGKVKTKRHLLSYFVLTVSECCPRCQLLQTGTFYHITYFWLLQVAPILWHYIDWWCLFMKHMWCHLVAK